MAHLLTLIGTFDILKIENQMTLITSRNRIGQKPRSWAIFFIKNLKAICRQLSMPEYPLFREDSGRLSDTSRDKILRHFYFWLIA